MVSAASFHGLRSAGTSQGNSSTGRNCANLVVISPPPTRRTTAPTATLAAISRRPRNRKLRSWVTVNIGTPAASVAARAARLMRSAPFIGGHHR